jgi:Glycosyl transferase family 11
MITFSRLGTYGRLGNQLFQYAILLAVGAKNKYEVKIPSLDDKEWHGQKCLLKNFNITAKTLDSNDVIEHHYIETEHSNCSYDLAVFDVLNNTDLFGYFGDFRYLREYENIISKELSIKEDIFEKNKQQFLKIKEKHNEYLIVSLHIRRGDTSLDMYDKKDSPWQTYFSNARRIFENKKCKFLVFTGGAHSNNNESDYTWCKKNLIGEEFIYCENNNGAVDDFALMCLCDAHILSASSTLSWWVGFLDKKNNKITVAPEKYWFLTKSMPEGFYPNNFILV